MFDTERLTLRAFVDSDMPQLMQLANDAEVNRLSSTEYLVPRSAKFEDIIRGWVRVSTRVTIALR